MNYIAVKASIWTNALSNYLRTIIGMVVGVLTFRLLFQSFGQEEFGFWSLLWSVFGYGILLDFGCGFAAQKRVAELSVARDWAKLSQVLSTIFTFYTSVALLLAATALLGSQHLISYCGISPAREEEFRSILVLFFLGIGLSFPLGIFQEILRGQQRIALANNLTIGCMLIRLGLIYWAVATHASMFTIMSIALGFALLPDALAVYFALRGMPEVKLRPSLASRSIMQETVAFSLFAYIGTATNIILGKSDQLVLSGTLGILAVATYQAAAKVSEIYAQFTKQLQDTLSPAAAHLHASGDRAALADLIVKGTRWSVLISTPLYVLSAFYLPQLLSLLTGSSTLPQPTYLTAQVLLLWFYTTTITHSVSKRIFIMTGHERKLMWLGLAEALANLLLSLLLVHHYRSIVAVAVGSLIPTLIIGWSILWPWTARASAHSPLTLLRITVVPPLLASAPLALLLTLISTYGSSLYSSSPLLTLLTHGPAAALIATLSIWALGLTPAERSTLRQRLPRRDPLPA